MNYEEDAIVPLCLYQSGTNSLISYPAKIRNNETITTVCQDIPEMNFVGSFYVINPDVHPIPSGMDLICIENSDNVSTGIKQLYDPFNIDEKCLRFIAWMEAVPYTTPLYFWTDGTELYISFTDTVAPDGFSAASIPVIYVLTDPRENYRRIAAPRNVNTKQTFTIRADGSPFFSFSGYQGKCIPDPAGQHLGKCIVLIDKDVLTLNEVGQENGIIEYLTNHYGKKDKSIFFLSVIFGLVIIYLIGLFLSI